MESCVLLFVYPSPGRRWAKELYEGLNETSTADKSSSIWIPNRAAPCLSSNSAFLLCKCAEGIRT